MTSLSERLRQGLAVAMVSAAATTSASAIALGERTIAQQPAASPQSRGAGKPAPRPSSKAASTPTKKGLPSSSQRQAERQAGGCAPDQGGCGPAR